MKQRELGEREVKYTIHVVNFFLVSPKGRREQGFCGVRREGRKTSSWVRGSAHQRYAPG